MQIPSRVAAVFEPLYSLENAEMSSGAFYCIAAVWM
jgi:hypothetical protein